MLNNSSIDSNISEINGDDPWSNLNVPYTIAEILVAAAAVIGNLLVIVVYLKERRLRKRTKYYIISLAIADLLVGFFGIPFAILASIGLPRNIYLCLFNMSLLVVLCTISIYCLVAVSVDRYWAILYPMSYSRNVRSKTAVEIILICWLAGAVVGFLPLLGWNEGGPIDRNCFFVEVMNYDYLVFLYFATIIAPAILLAAFYTHIYKVVRRQVRQMVMLSPGSSSLPKSSGGMLRVLGAAQRREVKATQNLSIIVFFFILCWFPLYTINFVKALCRDCDISPILTNSCIILSHLNSSFNPFLYAYHLKDFRVALHNLIFGNNDIPLRRIKSSYLKRPRTGLSSRYNPPLPTSSIRLCKDETRTNADLDNWHVINPVWTFSDITSDYKSVQKYFPNHYVIPKSDSSYPGNQKVNRIIIPCKKSRRITSSSEISGLIRSHSMFAFQTTRLEELFYSPKLSLELENTTQNANRQAIEWSCEYLKSFNSI